MYSTTTPYTEIGNVRAALTSFAAQVVKVKLVKDVKAAVRVSGGMHAKGFLKLVGFELLRTCENYINIFARGCPQILVAQAECFFTAITVDCKS
jgi:hypothetical protein